MTESLLKIKIFVAVALIFSVVPVFAEQVVEVQNKAYWLCKNRKEVRTIRVQINKEGICSTYYSKLGSEKSVGSGQNQESCMGFLNNIKTNLEKSSWTCRDISSTRITASVE